MTGHGPGTQCPATFHNIFVTASKQCPSGQDITSQAHVCHHQKIKTRLNTLSSRSDGHTSARSAAVAPTRCRSSARLRSLRPACSTEVANSPRSATLVSPRCRTPLAPPRLPHRGVGLRSLHHACFTEVSDSARSATLPPPHGPRPARPRFLHHTDIAPLGSASSTTRTSLRSAALPPPHGHRSARQRFLHHTDLAPLGGDSSTTRTSLRSAARPPPHGPRSARQRILHHTDLAPLGSAYSTKVSNFAPSAQRNLRTRQAPSGATSTCMKLAFWELRQLFS